MMLVKKSRRDGIRTHGLFVPNEALYQTEPHAEQQNIFYYENCIYASKIFVVFVLAIMTTSSAGGFLCGYKPVVLAGSKEPLKIRHAHSYHRQALKGFSLCLVYWLTRKRVYVLFQ